MHYASSTGFTQRHPMNVLFMSCKITAQTKARRTHRTFKWPLLQMNRLNMLDHIPMQRKRHMTSLTCMLSLGVMTLPMTVQVRRAAKPGLTSRTFKRPFPIMSRPHMLNQQILMPVRPTTPIAFERARQFMHRPHMFLHV